MKKIGVEHIALIKAILLRPVVDKELDFSTSVEIRGVKALYSSTSLRMTMLCCIQNDNCKNTGWLTREEDGYGLFFQ